MGAKIIVKFLCETSLTHFSAVFKKKPTPMREQAENCLAFGVLRFVQ
jgi:hypothetical protein